MKRSEMILKLKSFLEDVIIMDNGTWLSKEILDILEEAGMMPPSVGVGEKDDWGYLNYENKWEEDET